MQKSRIKSRDDNISKFYWDVYSNVGTQGRRLDEGLPVPETGYTIQQHSLQVFEAANSVPYTGKLLALAKHQVAAIIDKTLKDDARSNMSAIAA